MNNLDRAAGVSLWRQIAAALRAEITAGTISPAGGSAGGSAGRLPTEAALVARFGVNRHTVRQAVQALAADGLVRVERGRGVFVVEDVLDYTVEPRTRFSEWVRRHNKEPSGQVLRLVATDADAMVAAGLGLPTGHHVVLLERLGFADDRPVSLTRHFFPRPEMLAALRDQSSITVALSRVGVADYRRAISRVSARLPTVAEAGHLRMPRNRPVLVAENTNVDAAGLVVEFAVGCYPTPRVQIVFEP